MDKQFILNHVHGFYRSFEQVLAEWNPDEETLVVMGNICDYGHNSFLIYTKLFQLDFFYPGKVVFLKGKHELAFEEFYANPYLEYENYFAMGGLTTLSSFYEKGLPYEEQMDTPHLLDEVLPYIDFSILEYYLQKAVPYYETEGSIYISEEKSVIDTILAKQWQSGERKMCYLTSQSDNDFRIHYLNLYLGEEILRTSQGKQLAPVLETNCAFFGETSYPESGAHTTAFRVMNGKIMQEIKIPATE